MTAFGENGRSLSASERAELRDKVARARLEKQDAESRERTDRLREQGELDLGTAPLGELRERFA